MQVLALAAGGVALGGWLKRRLPVLDRLSIPAAIAGGLSLALISLALHSAGVDFKPDPALRDVFQLFCFTIIGFNASITLIRAGGAQVVVLLALATAGAVLQNTLGVSLARIFGLNPLVGVLAGAVSLAGGPATSLAFGATFEKAGVPAATTIALASATFGITVSGLVAGYAGARLIQGRAAADSVQAAVPSDNGGAAMPVHILLIAVTMGLGSLVSAAIERTWFVLPAYIGAMIVAAAARNLDDRTGWLRLSGARLGEAFGVALPLFIAMAMLTLRLWELAALAAPLLAILAAQTLLTLALTMTVVYWALGRSRDAAVMSAGYCGFMLGVTANAIASMEELVERFGPAPRAFVVVPMVGAFLIDFTNALVITATANLIGR